MTASSSRLTIKPSWPDEEAPWRLAGGPMKWNKQRDDSHKVAKIQRYLDNPSDESSDEED